MNTIHLLAILKLLISETKTGNNTLSIKSKEFSCANKVKFEITMKALQQPKLVFTSCNKQVKMRTS